jgi:putative ABC transport system permease protein
MLRSYFVIAWRTLRKRIGPAAINVTGLATGLAACLLIGLWVQHELSYDAFHPDANRIHRVVIDTKAGGNAIYAPQVPVPLKDALRREAPEVEAVTQFRPEREAVLQHGNQAFTNHTVVHADSTFLDVFGGFDLVHGDRRTALDGANAVLLTVTTAERLFGRTDVVGETVRLDGTARQVTGVLADVPETSHLQFDALVAYTSVPPVFQGNWTGFAFFTYAKLVENAPVAAFEDKLSTIATTYGAADVADRFNFPPEEITYGFFAEPLTDIHLYSDFNSLDAGGSITTVYVFGAIGLFILLIACINFTNLATARASERATEVGMRKALGAGRPQLAGQFLGEAILTTAAATGGAMLLAMLALPVFNELAGTSFGVNAFVQPHVVLGGLALVLIVGVVSGSYPAFALSRFAPAAVLKASGRHSSGGQGQRLRQGLVVVQFAISIALIVGTLVAREQFDYIQSKRLGFEKERVVEIEDTEALEGRQTAFVDRVRQLPGVTAASAGDGLFGGSSGNAFWPADSASTASQVLRFFRVSPRFVETMGIEVVEGRSFDPARPADSSAVIINQAAVDAYGWAHPTQQRLASADTSVAMYDVIGVVDNFHFQSMRQEVEPAALFVGHPFGAGRPSPPSSVYARLAPGASSDALDALRTVWEDVAGPAAPFQYSFLDQTYDMLHADVQRAGRLFTLFAGLAILIACLGLFGLATYTVQRREKEIGIRKALGATAAQVVGLLSKQFLRLVALAAVVALPLAYLAMQRWLQDFAYRTTVGADVLIGAAVLASLIALLAIGYQALRAAWLSPAVTLKDE